MRDEIGQQHAMVNPGSGPSLGGNTPSPACLVYMRSTSGNTELLLELYLDETGGCIAPILLGLMCERVCVWCECLGMGSHDCVTWGVLLSLVASVGQVSPLVHLIKGCPGDNG